MFPWRTGRMHYIVRSKAAGFDHYLLEPVELHLVRAVLASYVAMRDSGADPVEAKTLKFPEWRMPSFVAASLVVRMAPATSSLNHR